LTAWGANEHTPLMGMKSLNANVDRLKALEKFVKSSDASDETIELLILEIKQLNQVIDDLVRTQPTDSVPANQNDFANELKNAFDILTYKHLKQ
jgi:hypothetical protein